MARITLTPVERQLRAARRRLFIQQLGNALVASWSLALLTATTWFLAQPFLVSEPATWLRWAVAGGLLTLATSGALILTIARRPTRTAAALALDERFGLRERVTTSVLLSGTQAESPAAVALRDDVNQRVAGLRVADRFPLRLPRHAWTLTLTVLVLGLIAAYYHPRPSVTQAAEQRMTADPEAVAEVEKELQKLQRKSEPREKDRPKSEELERLEAELDRLARQPRDSKDEARELVKEMSQLEDEMARREKELAEKAEALKAQLKQAERLSKKKDGPAKDLDKALSQGDFEKAKEQAEQLSRKLKNEEEADRLRKKKKDDTLSPEELQRINEQLERLEKEGLSRQEKDELQEQFKDLQDRLERLSRSQEAQEQHLRDLAEKGELNEEELDRELEQCKNCNGKMDEKTRAQLKKIAGKLQEAREAMQEGKNDEAARKLEEAAEEMAKLNPDAEGEQLAAQLRQLQQARKAICQALDGKPAPAAGRRPESPDGPTKSREERAKSPLDQGKLQVIDHIPGGGFKGPRKPEELVEDIQRAAQDAPEAIDRQRLPKSAGKMARGYFERLRGADAAKSSRP